MDTSTVKPDKETEILCKIIENFLHIEQETASAYRKMASLAPPDQKAFWEKAARDEDEHIEFWHIALQSANQGHIPPIFDSPAETLEGIEKLALKIHDITEKLLRHADEPRKALAIALKLEFCNLCAELPPLCSVVKRATGLRTSPYDEFYDHLSAFIEQYKEYADDEYPEILTLIEANKRLWAENVKLRQHCNTDELTNLLNRRGFISTGRPLMNLAKRKHLPLLMIITDIDEFKEINDQFGHHLGDMVIKETAAILKQQLRESDLIGRYGGDEFVIFCPGVEPEHSELILEKLRKAIESNSIEGHKITISLGAVEADIRNSTLSGSLLLKDLVMKADLQLYEAKGNGKNCFKCRKMVL